VNNPKKIIPSTIGLTIMPSRTPNFIHSIFNGRRASLFTNVITRNIENAATNVYTNIIFKEYKK
jgi:hypothetical protein